MNKLGTRVDMKWQGMNPQFDFANAVKNWQNSSANLGASGTNLFELKNPRSFKGSSIKDVESYLNDALSGFEKQPLKRGEGIRYFDGKGNSCS